MNTRWWKMRHMGCFKCLQRLVSYLIRTNRLQRLIWKQESNVKMATTYLKEPILDRSLKNMRKLKKKKTPCCKRWEMRSSCHPKIILTINQSQFYALGRRKWKMMKSMDVEHKISHLWYCHLRTRTTIQAMDTSEKILRIEETMKARCARTIRNQQLTTLKRVIYTILEVTEIKLTNPAQGMTASRLKPRCKAGRSCWVLTSLINLIFHNNSINNSKTHSAQRLLAIQDKRIVLSIRWLTFLTSRTSQVKKVLISIRCWRPLRLR